MGFDPVTTAALPSRWVTHLHILRHGKVDTGGQRRAYGHLDLPLAAEGRRQADGLVAFACADLPRPDVVWSSDLVRCRGTAERIATSLGVPLRCTSALREQSMGAWEGRTWKELTADDEPAIQDYWDNYSDAVPPGGESWRMCAQRVWGWLDEVGPELRDRRAIVVAHMGTLRALLCRALGVPVEDALRFTPVRGSHTHLILADAGACVERMGQPLVRRLVASDPGRRPRVALSGSSGTGKTTLGQRLADRLGVTFIDEGFRRRLEAGLDVHALGRDGFRALMWELWEELLAAEADAIARTGGFVSDRSSIDFAAFWMHYRFTDHVEETERFVTTTLDHARHYDRIVALPWGVLPLVDDGVRHPNRWLQRHFQATLEGFLYREVEPSRLMWLGEVADLDEREARVLASLVA